MMRERNESVDAEGLLESVIGVHSLLTVHSRLRRLFRAAGHQFANKESE